jgi:type II secretory pathway component PulK
MTRNGGTRVRITKPGQRGMVLILAVFAVSLLLVLAVGLSTVVRAELLASRASLERVQSRFLAEAGISQARAILLYEDQNSDTLQDPWGLEAETPLDWPDAVGEAGYCRIRVHDACGRIDINAASFETLSQLTGDPSVATAIIDWRTQGSLEEYYRTLPYPYLPRKGSFQSPGELLLVQGVTPELYFGAKDRPGLVNLISVISESPNTDANGERRIGLNEFRAWDDPGFQRWAEERLGEAQLAYEIWCGFVALTDSGQQGYTSLSQLATVAGISYDKIIRVVDVVTADSSGVLRGRVNVNTAPMEVLAAIPGCSAQLAEVIVAQREKEPFVSLNEVAELIYSGGGGLHAFELMIDHVTTKSSCFLIDAMGYPTETGRGFRTIRALVRRTKDQVYVLRQTEEDAPLPPPLAEAEARKRSRRS